MVCCPLLLALVSGYLPKLSLLVSGPPVEVVGEDDKQ